MKKVGIIVGSLSASSINKRLAQAIAGLGQDRFAFSFIEIGDLPLYNRDLDGAMPASVLRFKDAVKAADSLLIVSPEYNRGVSAALKNALEWGSRPYGQSVFPGKSAAIAGASGGNIGTAIAQQPLRNILSHMGVAVLPGPEIFLKVNDDVIAPDGTVKDEGVKKLLAGFVDAYATWAARF